MTNDWQPVETAPSDVEVLFYEDGYYYSGKLREDGGYWYIEAECGQPVVYTPEPSHWIPLPKPPKRD